MSDYDAVVIGNNLNGLACGCLMAEQGWRVLAMGHSQDVFESSAEEAGGQAPAASYSWDCSRGAMNYFLKIMDADTEKWGEKAQRLDRILLRNLDIQRPNSWPGFREQMLELFPLEKDPLLAYFNEMELLASEWIALLKANSLAELAKLKNIRKYRDTVYSDYLDRNFSNGHLKRILSANVPRVGAALPVMAGYMVSQLFDYHVIPGGYGTVSRQLANLFLKHHGQYNPALKAKDIEIESTGFKIRVESGETVGCKSVVSTYDETITQQRYGLKTEDSAEGTAKSGNEEATVSVRLHLGPDYDFGPIQSLFMISYFPDAETKNDFPIRIYPENGQRSILVQTYSRPDENPALWISRMRTGAQKALGFEETQVRNVDIHGSQRVERTLGYTNGNTYRWAFTPQEMRINPLENCSFRPGIFTTG
jgi:phytoene dehydrogenase-like protein